MQSIDNIHSFNHIRVNHFTEESAANFHNQLMTQANISTSCPITIYIDSYGGSMDALASMIDSMEFVPNKTITVCTGKAMSSAAILLSAGDYRLCGRHSRIMIHEVHATLNGSISSNHITGISKEINKLNTYWLDFLAKKCGMKGHNYLRSILYKKPDKEIVLNANEAKAFGIIDDIGLPMITPVELYHATPNVNQKIKSKKRSKKRNDANRYK